MAKKPDPKGNYALPGKRFPLNDKKHDRLAIGGATRAERAGNISEAQEDSIKSKARRNLGKPGKPGGKSKSWNGA